VAWKLLSRGLYVSGLIRSLQRGARGEVSHEADGHGEAR